MSALNAISQQAREVLLEALMSVAWADRVLVDEEVAAAQGAALSLGLVLNQDRDLTCSERRPVPPEQLDAEVLGQRDRELVFLCAAWMALADEVEDPSETQILERLQARFHLDGERAEWLKARAASLRSGRPVAGSAWREFDALVVAAARALDEKDAG